MKKETTGKKDQKPSYAGIAEYLKGPKRKQKSYIVIALSSNVDVELTIAVENFLTSNYKTQHVVNIKSVKELKRVLLRQIVLLVIDDEFMELTECLDTIKFFKEKKHEESMPVLIFTRDPNALILKYQQLLLAYHETDEYLVHPKLSQQQVLNRIKTMLETSDKRRSRRYQVKIPVSFYHIGKEQELTGEFLDLSIHGAMLKNNSASGQNFKENDQLWIVINVGSYVESSVGELLKLTAKVRRVFISGTQAGISFEYLNETQLRRLTELITKVVQKQVTRENKFLTMQRKK